MRADKTILDSMPLAVGLCGLWVASVVLREWNHEQLDTSALYYASRFFALGVYDLVYDASSPFLLWYDEPAEWREMGASLGQQTETYAAYVYPPLWAWVISFASTAMSPFAFYNAANALFAGGFALGLLAFARALGAGTPVLIWLLVSLGLMELTMIGQTALQLGQPQTFVTGLILAAFAAYHRSRFILAGVLLALATAIKVSPLVFVVIFLADRNWRALAAFVVCGAALGVLSIAVAGWPMHDVFLGRLATMKEMILLSRINLSVQSLATYFIGGAVAYEGYIWVELPSSIRWVSSVMTLLAVVGTMALRRRNGMSERGLITALLFLGLAMPLSAPLGWIHYLLLVIAVAPGMIAFVRSRVIYLALALFGAVFSLPVFGWLLTQHMALSTVFFTFWIGLFCLLTLLLGLTKRV